MNWRNLLTPWLSNAALRHQVSTLTTALSNSNSRVLDLQSKLEVIQSTKCEACEVLKQQVNHLLLASGSRVKMFDGYGPTLPTPAAPVESKPGITPSARMSKTVRRINEDFLARYAAETGEPLPFDDETAQQPTSAPTESAAQ